MKIILFLRPLAVSLALLIGSAPLPARAEPAAGDSAQAETPAAPSVQAALQEWAQKAPLALSAEEAGELAKLAERHASVDLRTAKELAYESYLHRAERPLAGRKRTERFFAAIESKRLAKAQALREAKRENELFAWMYSGDDSTLNLSRETALEAAELLSRFPGAKLEQLQAIGRAEAHRANGDIPSGFLAGLRATVTALESAPARFPAVAASADLIAKLYSWLYSGPLDLGSAEARALALAAAEVPGIPLDRFQRLFAAIRKGESNSDSAVREIKKELELLKSNPKAISDRIARHELRAELYSIFYVTADMNSGEALALRDFFGEFPPAASARIRTAGALFRSGYLGSGEGRVAKLKEMFKDPATIDQTLTTLKSRVELFDYAYHTVDLYASDSVRLADLLAEFPPSLMAEAKAVVKEQLTLSKQTTERNRNDLWALLSSVPRTREGLAAAFKTLRYRRAILEWAYSPDGLKQFYVEESTELADLLIPALPERDFESIKPLLKQQRHQAPTSAALLRQLREALASPDRLSELLSTWSWTEDAAGNITGCLQKSILRPSLMRTHPTGQCLERLPVEYKKNSQRGCLAYSGRKPVGAVKEDLCESPLREEYLPFVKTIAQPVAVFHYTDGHRLGYHGEVPLGAPEVKTHAQDWSRYFWDPNRHGKGENTGLYAATDPAYTLDYGGRSPVLYEVFLPAGTRTLDISDVIGNFSEKAQAYLQSKGCTESKQQLVGRNAGLSKACLQELHALMRSLDVTALQYTYGETYLPDCNRRAVRAFILLSIPEVKIFSNDLRSLTPEDKMEFGFIREFARKHSADYSPYTFPGATSAAIPTPTKEELTRWRGERLYGCENLRPPPPRTPPKVPPAAECPPDAGPSSGIQKQLNRLSTPLQGGQ